MARLKQPQNRAEESSEEAVMVVETRTENALDRFVRHTRELFAREPDVDRRWVKLEPVLAELLADPSVLEASKSWPDCEARDGRAENLLFYVDPDFGFAVNGLVKNGNRGISRIHDHAHIYTLYGVLDGHECVERYDRLDDRSRPEWAEIKLASDKTVSPGEIDLVRPYEIHRENTIGERTVAVIIRSEMGGTFKQGRYIPEKNEYFESLGPRQTRMEMLPKK
jgi:predicted metal-dependent enzyme (double-stranded beta helix superfamily)